jgi:transcriptional regulator with XRE-family HTH domain
MGHTQESFSRELGVSLPTVGKWEANGRLPLDIMLARLRQIALAQDPPHQDLADVFTAGLEELRAADRSQKAIDIFDEIARWHTIREHMKALGEEADRLRDEKLKDAELPQRIVDRLYEFEKVLAAAQRWSWRNR